jgi:hypothetical protein
VSLQLSRYLQEKPNQFGQMNCFATALPMEIPKRSELIVPLVEQLRVEEGRQKQTLLTLQTAS